jgi:mRNA-degrading endonuclease toxin of MazEF toxin-antitoxin module
MSIIVPLTTEIRGGDCEVAFQKPPWLKSDSVVNVLGIAGIDNARILRRLAKFPPQKLDEIYKVLERTFGF